MLNNDIIRYLNNEIDYLDKILFEQQIENDLFLKESIEGLKLWKEANKNQSLENLNNSLNEMIDKINKNGK